MMLNMLNMPKKKDNLSKMDRGQEEFLPQLSNEMQLSIMNKVKSGEMTIEDALNQAKKDRQQLLKQKTVDEVQPTQYNFSVYKNGRYRWQKRVLQIDFNTKMVCSIEKGIIKRQLPFAIVKSCDDGVGSRFSVSFKEHHDYELEATSVDDKHKIMELVNQIIYGNIYSQPTEGSVDTHQQPPETKSLRYGVLFLHKGGLASFKWVKYEVHLHPAQLTMVRVGPMGSSDSEVTSTVTPSIVIHLSDGDTSVEKPHSPDSFTLITHKNEYHFRVPVTDQTKSSEVLQKERDAWVQAIDKLCLEWKRMSQSENIYDKPRALGLQGLGTAEDTEPTLSTGTHVYSNLMSSGGHGLRGSDIKRSLPLPPAARDTSLSNPPAAYGKPPVAKPRSIPKATNTLPGPDAVPTSSMPASLVPTSLVPASPVPASPVPASPVHVPASPVPVSLVPTSPVPTSPVPTSLVPTSLVPTSFMSSSPLPSSAVPISLAASSALASSTPTSSPAHSALYPACTTNVPLFPVCSTVPSACVGPTRVPPPPPLFCKPNVIPPAERTKPFHWDLIVSDKIERSFWMRARTIEVDTLRLFEQFAAQDLGAVSLVESSNSIDILLDQKIAHNFNIFLKSFPVQPGELKDKLFIIKEEDGGLSDEQITSLRRYVPTPDDVEMYKAHQGPVAELHIVDQYMMEMCNIPYLSTRLDLLLTLRELPISMNDLQPLINQKIRMCTQLYNTRSFVSVLEYLRAVGNYLNKNAGKEKAKGFRLSSLTKLSQLRGKTRKFTLLHALVEQIMLHEPAVGTNLIQELAEFETVPGASIKGLTAEVDVLKNELQKVIQYRKTYKKRNARDQHLNFSNDLKMAVEKYKAELSVLTKKCEEMKKLYSDILVKFGEPIDRDSQELFGLVCQFIHDFRRTRAEVM